jgi:hypothetical protein
LSGFLLLLNRQVCPFASNRRENHIRTLTSLANIEEHITNVTLFQING